MSSSSFKNDGTYKLFVYKSYIYIYIYIYIYMCVCVCVCMCVCVIYMYKKDLASNNLH